jgi:NAD(P)-dependent dehydrogenase (short-subunit alcohol dehydrogenase family)
MAKKGIKQKIKQWLRAIVLIFKTEKKIPIPEPINCARVLEGKVALITGGSGGIGYSIAESFIRSGCKVIIAGTKEEKLLECQKKLEKVISDSKTGAIEHIVINMSDISSLLSKIKTAGKLFEENKIDILVNSAGIGVKHTFMDIDENEYDNIMDVNVKGTFFICQAMGKYMIERKIKGHILNLSSSSALRPAWTPYEMSKWSIRGFTIGLADTLLPYGIIVNAIAPGPTLTPMLEKREGDSIYNEMSPSGRFAMPSEIASLATFMVSDFGNLIVGDTYYITGGSGTISMHR